MTKHIMLDLETMSTSSSPAITEIAAVEFSLDGTIGKEFHVGVNLQSSIDSGLDVSASTIEFWMRQPLEVRASFLKSQSNSKDIFDVLLDLRLWIETLGKEDIRVWGNGIMADNRWLESAVERVGLDPLIKHWQHSDIRTVVDMGEWMGLKNYKKELVFEGVKHNPVDDCKHQIKYLCAYLKDMGV